MRRLKLNTKLGNQRDLYLLYKLIIFTLLDRGVITLPFRIAKEEWDSNLDKDYSIVCRQEIEDGKLEAVSLDFATQADLDEEERLQKEFEKSMESLKAAFGMINPGIQGEVN